MTDFSLDYFDKQVNSLRDDFLKASARFAEAKNSARVLEDMEKATLADIIRKMEADGLKGSVDMKRLLAHGTPEFRAYLKGKHAAQFEADKAYFEMELVRWRMEMLRSRFSFQKTIIEAGG